MPLAVTQEDFFAKFFEVTYVQIPGHIFSVITARVRSTTREGTVFTGVCSHPRGGGTQGRFPIQGRYPSPYPRWVPPPPTKVSTPQAFATWRAVCLLHLRRRTFLFQYIIFVLC